MMERFLERYIATLIGCALGDTLGMPVEGWKRVQIKKHVGRITAPLDPVIVRDEAGNILDHDEFGKLKCYSREAKKGDYTDDTILTLALAESIANFRGYSISDIAQRQLQEYKIRLRADGTVEGGFGGTTIEAFKKLMQGIPPQESGVIGGPGNAPAMKMSPLGLYAHATHKYDDGLWMAQAVGRITHLDPRSVVSGVVQAHAIYAALRDYTREEFVESCHRICSNWEKPLTSEYSWHERGNLTSRLEWIKENKDTTPDEAHAHLGSKSTVYSSYPFALFMFQKYWDDPINGLLETVNYGGDCDTTGAMYGALCGAKNGMVFPKEWVDVLQGKERLIQAAEGIYALTKKE